ncbi:ornithine cyclodeaminase family protein [Ornithinicoccus halotolerans]|uniref:ornithine cyclodeaminase family protein n=1 Tax=Ornithinicoccus halotolerans TaxID=1748220 RepID=UPI0012980CBA|nr:ornithine cyclodeaminase family protein [Ornithinicoccus halotolerans]
MDEPVVPPPWLGERELFENLGWAGAVQAVGEALAAGLDPAQVPARQAVPVAAGELLLMPAEWGGSAGVKVAGVAPGNPERGLPRIQGTYLLLDAATLTLRALVDGTALTTLRTPAVSAWAAAVLARPDAARLVVFGSGPQAWGHVHALRAVRPLTDVGVCGRDPGRRDALVARLREEGVAARPVGAEAVGEADVVACCTSSRTPVLDGALVRDGSCVVAVGSHHPAARELDGALLARSTVVVEDRDTALREAGDVVLAVQEGLLDPAALVGVAELARDRAQLQPWGAGPRVFKGSGMAWEDLVVATAAHHAAAGADGGGSADPPGAGRAKVGP